MNKAHVASLLDRGLLRAMKHNQRHLLVTREVLDEPACSL